MLIYDGVLDASFHLAGNVLALLFGIVYPACNNPSTITMGVGFFLYGVAAFSDVGSKLPNVFIGRARGWSIAVFICSIMLFASGVLMAIPNNRDVIAVSKCICITLTVFIFLTEFVMALISFGEKSTVSYEGGKRNKEQSNDTDIFEDQLKAMHKATISDGFGAKEDPIDG